MPACVLRCFNRKMRNRVLTTPQAAAASDTLFQEVIQANLFLLPLDEEGRWFRYHHLFRDFLSHLLQREGTPEESSRYHHRAARWFEQHGLIDEALNLRLLPAIPNRPHRSWPAIGMR